MARPREFDEQTALHEATVCFWRYGYAGATSARLRDATGLNPPSLQRAFGPKPDLFLRCLEYYSASLEPLFEPLLRGEGGLDDVDAFFELLRQSKHEPGVPGGCLLASTLADPDVDRAATGPFTDAYVQRLDEGFTAALRRSVELGELEDGAAEVLPRAISVFVVGFMHTTRELTPPYDDEAVAGVRLMLDRWRAG